MMKYERPIIQINSETAEGVYAASGDLVLKCDSTVMNGIWQAPDYRPWAEVGGSMGYKQYYGCLGCPANTGSNCAIASNNHYDESGNAASYDTDNGNRLPKWEKAGKGADETVTDFGLGS